MGTHIFRTTDSIQRDRNGSEVTIQRTITEPENGFVAEVLPMYVVVFDSDGTTLEVWPDELTAK